MESVPPTKVQEDNPHGTKWSILESHTLEACQCNEGDGCDNVGQYPKRCSSCSGYFCEYCSGYRGWQRWRSEEDFWADYGYHQPTGEWHLWAN